MKQARRLSSMETKRRLVYLCDYSHCETRGEAIDEILQGWDYEEENLSYEQAYAAINYQLKEIIYQVTH